MSTFPRDRLALFDNKNFIEDPLGGEKYDTLTKDWTTFDNFENLQHQFAKGYINKMLQK